MISPLNLGDCKEFLCQTSEYCLNPRNGLSPCTETKSMCIDQSLVCNGLPNCSEQDSSDEDKCMYCLIGLSFSLFTSPQRIPSAKQYLSLIYSRAPCYTISLPRLEWCSLSVIGAQLCWEARCFNSNGCVPSPFAYLRHISACDSLNMQPLCISSQALMQNLSDH